MAVDKLVDSAQLDADLTSVANAIRTKGGTSADLAFPAGFVSAVQAIPTGGGGWTEFTAASGASGGKNVWDLLFPSRTTGNFYCAYLKKDPADYQNNQFCGGCELENSGGTGGFIRYRNGAYNGYGYVNNTYDAIIVAGDVFDIQEVVI